MTATAASPWKGGTVAEGVMCVLAPNPSPWTLEGTNTWIIGSPDGSCVVIDPGPADAAHLHRISQSVPSNVRAIILTHAHIDHSEGAPDLSELLRVPVIPQTEIDGMDLGGATLRMHATPGHSSDSVCITVTTSSGRYLLSGDTLLGRGTTLVAHPDGRLDQYFDSLRYLRDHCLEEKIDLLLPGHGPISDIPVTLIDFYEKHRRERLEQVRAAVNSGLTTVPEITSVVYKDVDPGVLIAAELTVAAQLEYLRNN
jgi:glyoxylase-like metal-dependent hydrolase (beta-lactamase superfamily II)